MFPGRNVAMNETDVNRWEGLQPDVKRGRLNRAQVRIMYDIYNRTFNAAAKPCNCTGKNQQMVEKLQRAYELRCEL